MPPSSFQSCFRKVGALPLPAFTGKRLMMMPLVLGDLGSVPDFLADWKPALEELFRIGGHAGEVGYLTLDEKRVMAGTTHRRAGAHVDGVYQGCAGGWGGGGWGSAGNGMLTVSSAAGCRAWNQEFIGWPGLEGECEHLLGQARPDAETLFDAHTVYWVDGLCVHESLPMPEDTLRQFVRLSLPSPAPWFEGYTENPLGVKPTGPILPRRSFM